MNAFNRWALVTVALVWIGLMLAVVYLTWGADRSTIDALRDLAVFFDDHTDNFSKIVLTLGALVLLLGALLLLVAELVPETSTDIRLGQVAGGSVVLAPEAITQRVEQALLDLPRINQAKASVVGRGKGVEVALDLLVDPESNITLLTEEAVRTVRRTVEEKIGIPLLSMPTVRLRYSAPAPRAAAAPASPPPQPGAPLWGPSPPASGPPPAQQEEGQEPPAREG